MKGKWLPIVVPVSWTISLLYAGRAENVVCLATGNPLQSIIV
jgi:hypothetical protein